MSTGEISSINNIDLKVCDLSGNSSSQANQSNNGLANNPLFSGFNNLNTTGMFETMQVFDICQRIMYGNINDLRGLNFGGGFGGYGGYGGYGYGSYGNYDVQAPRCSTVDKGAESLSGGEPVRARGSAYYPETIRGEKLNKNQEEILKNHNTILKYMDKYSSEGRSVEQEVVKLEVALKNNEEAQARKILKRLSEDPLKLAAVELKYRELEPGKDLRKDIVDCFGYYGTQWFRNFWSGTSEDADAMLKLMNKAAAVYPANAALAIKNAVQGGGTYEDVITDVIVKNKPSKEFLQETERFYTEYTNDGSLLGAITDDMCESDRAEIEAALTGE